MANSADLVYDPFQDFEHLSRSLGFTSDWSLSSEPDLTQFMMHDFMAPASGQDQEQLSQLPVEKDSIGWWLYISCILV